MNYPLQQAELIGSNFYIVQWIGRLDRSEKSDPLPTLHTKPWNYFEQATKHDGTLRR